MTSYDDLYVYMIPELGSCPRSLAIQRLKLAGQVFCTRSEAWTQLTENIDVVAGRKNYLVPLQHDALVKRIRRAWYPSIKNANIIDPADYDFDPPRTLSLVNAYTTAKADALHVRLVLVPILSTNELVDDEDFFERWGTRGIMAHALWKLLGMKKPWADPVKAREYEIKYLKAVAEARKEWEVGKKDGDLVVDIPAFV